MKKPSNILDDRPALPAIPVSASMREVSRLTGKSAAAQWREILELARGTGCLSPAEYYYFQLYDDHRFAPEEKRRFIGRHAQRDILRTCTDRRWYSPSRDKMMFHGLMHAYGLPVPRVIATLHPFRALPGARPLRTREEAADFLRHCTDYPLFAKPFDGIRSVGSVRIEAYDATRDELMVYPEQQVPLAAFIEDLARYASTGYMFQAVEHPHDTIRALCRDRLANVRLVLLYGERGPEPFRAVWKVPAGLNVADNYWRKGNLLGEIDIPSGRVTHVLTGTGLDCTDVERHPDTGASLKDFIIPDWSALKELCLSAATTLPGLTMQGWDVAPSARGPVLIEVNIGGDFNLPQLASGRGMLDERFRAYLARHRFRPRSFARRAGAYAYANARSAATTGLGWARHFGARKPVDG